MLSEQRKKELDHIVDQHVEAIKLITAGIANRITSDIPFESDRVLRERAKEEMDYISDRMGIFLRALAEYTMSNSKHP